MLTVGAMRRLLSVVTLGSLGFIGCVAEVAPDGSPSSVGRVEEAQTELVTINPCDGSWQLPSTFAPSDSNATVEAFLGGMRGTDARWVGQGGQLAIVRVDQLDKGKPFLWHLVVYPMSSARAAATVSAYQDRFPVWSKPIGYCWGDGQMHATKPPFDKPGFVVAEWDPGCNCTPMITGRLSELVGGRTTAITPRW